MFLWVAWGLVFLTWTNARRATVGALQCMEEKDINVITVSHLACQVGQAIDWLVIMCQCVVLGSTFILICSAGQSVKKGQHFLVLLSAVFVVLFAVVPAFQGIQLGELIDSKQVQEKKDQGTATEDIEFLQGKLC